MKGRLAALAWGMFALGLVGGTALDELPEPDPVVRGPYVVLAVDFHVHTRFSDGVLSPFDVVVEARRRGLDAVAVTEHNLVFPGLLARWFSRLTGGPLVLVGEEVTNRRVHIHGVGLERRVDWDQSPDAIIDAIHAQGGVAIGAHPFGRFFDNLLPVRDKLDAVEVVHPLAYFSGRRGDELRAFYTRAEQDGVPLAPVGSSDYHFFGVMGLVRTWVFTEAPTERGILDAVRARRTVVRDVDGRWWGDEGLVALLLSEPLPERGQPYGYLGNGLWDRALRAVGWLGLVLIVLAGLPHGRRRAPTVG